LLSQDFFAMAKVERLQERAPPKTGRPVGAKTRRLTATDAARLLIEVAGPEAAPAVLTRVLQLPQVPIRPSIRMIS
jgi:hypothetical protein